MSENRRQIVEFLAKYGAWVGYVAIGVIGKFGWDILNHRKISGWYVLGTGFCAVFVGWLASTYCMHQCPDRGPYIVPVLTLVSRDVMLFLTMLDWPRILKLVLDKNVGKVRKD